MQIGNAHKMKNKKARVRLRSFSNLIPHMQNAELLSIRFTQILTSTGAD